MARNKPKYSMSRVLRYVLRQKGPDGLRNDIAIGERLATMARAGDLDAIQYIFDRVDGKIPQQSQVAITGNEGGPLQMTVDSYLEERTIFDDETRRLAHQMLAQLVGTGLAVAALPEADEKRNGHGREDIAR